jgi:hypothetical protein
MSGFLPGFVLGLLLGLAAGVAACWGLTRVLMRVAGLPDARALGRFLVSGLRRHGRHDPVEVERTLSRALKDQYSVLASGTRLAAGAITLRVSPEDHAVLRDGLGVEAAAADLGAFYRRHATASGWQVLADPVVTIERDISLKPREAVAQREVRPGDPPAEQRAAGEGQSGGPAPRYEPADRRFDSAAPRSGPIPVPRYEPADRRFDSVAPRSGPIPVPPHDTAAPRSGPIGLPVADAAEGRTTPLPLGAFPDDPSGITEVLPATPLADGVVIRNGPSVVHVPASAGRATIGRAARSDVRVQAHGVADEHAVLERRGSDWYLVPRAPATFVGGERIDEPVRLTGTHILGIGRVARLEVAVGGPRA